MKFIQTHQSGRILFNLEKVLYFEKVQESWWAIFAPDHFVMLTAEEFNKILPHLGLDNFVEPVIVKKGQQRRRLKDLPDKKIKKIVDEMLKTTQNG